MDGSYLRDLLITVAIFIVIIGLGIAGLVHFVFWVLGGPAPLWRDFLALLGLLWGGIIIIGAVRNVWIVFWPR